MPGATPRPRGPPSRLLAPALAHGLAESLEQLEGETFEFVSRAATFLDGLDRHLVLAGGELVVAHWPAGRDAGPGLAGDGGRLRPHAGGQRTVDRRDDLH